MTKCLPLTAVAALVALVPAVAASASHSAAVGTLICDSTSSGSASDQFFGTAELDGTVTLSATAVNVGSLAPCLFDIELGRVEWQGYHPGGTLTITNDTSCTAAQNLGCTPTLVFDWERIMDSTNSQYTYAFWVPFHLTVNGAIVATAWVWCGDPPLLPDFGVSSPLPSDFPGQLLP